jgi:hypothetical protein
MAKSNLTMLSHNGTLKYQLISSYIASNDSMIGEINFKLFGRGLSWPNFRELSRHLPGGAGGNHEKPQSG